MVELQDFTGLKRSEKVTVPLNGVRYHCVPELAADSFLELAPQTQSEELPELPEGVTMDNLADLAPATAVKLENSGARRFVQMLRLLEEAMEPDSWDTWRTNMRRPAKGLTPAKRKQHQDRMITVPQMGAVFRALISHYAARPTEPSSSSSNGGGGTGGMSTAAAPSEA